jgi:hypothetical protein
MFNESAHTDCGMNDERQRVPNGTNDFPEKIVIEKSNTSMEIKHTYYDQQSTGFSHRL